MAKQYYSLLVREAGRWAVQFGDYDKEIVNAERDDYRDGSQGIKAKDMRVVATKGTQAAIDAEVARLNALAEVER